ncbi:MAG: SufD family Fe-S cluster assembly protein [Cyanobacteriota bacterium]|nr:SufD family Fe-S cluster assembly protein [Cyanobacteriota bacterium]
MPTLSPLTSPAAVHPGTPWMLALAEAFSAPPPAPETAGVPTSLPGRREEAWRFTDPSLLSQIPPRPLDPAPALSADLPAPAPHTWRLPLEAWSGGESLHWPTGIEPLTGPDRSSRFSQLLADTGVEPHWISRFNQGLAPAVIALRIRPGLRTSLEVLTDAAQRSGVHPHRLLLLLEEDASLELVQVHRARGSSLTSIGIAIHLERGARLHHTLVAQGSPSSALLAGTAVHQSPGSHYSHTGVSWGWGLARQEPVILQSGGNATTQLRGLHWVRDGQIADTHSRVCFAGPDGKLDQVHKVVAEETGRSVFNGCIQVPRLGQRTDASQLSRSLLLSDRARIDTKPELEIVADDVRCTHGATISRLQENELFYLQSRGIGAPQASRLLLRSFCQEVLADLPPAARVWNPLASLFEEAP